MNKIQIVGRLTKAPDLAYSAEGKPKGGFTLAVRRKFAKEGYQNTDFIFVRVLGKLAENCGNFLDKGKLAGVSGELRIDTSGEGQDRKQFVYVLADDVEFLSPKDSAPGESLGNNVEFDESSIPF